MVAHVSTSWAQHRALRPVHCHCGRLAPGVTRCWFVCRLILCLTVRTSPMQQCLTNCDKEFHRYHAYCSSFSLIAAPCRLRGCKNRLALFPGQMSYKATKTGSACHILACFILYCCLLGPLLCIISFRWYIFCLLVVLVKLSVHAKWFQMIG